MAKEPTVSPIEKWNRLEENISRKPPVGAKPPPPPPPPPPKK